MRLKAKYPKPRIFVVCLAYLILLLIWPLLIHNGEAFYSYIEKKESNIFNAVWGREKVKKVHSWVNVLFKKGEEPNANNGTNETTGTGIKSTQKTIAKDGIKQNGITENPDPGTVVVADTSKAADDTEAIVKDKNGKVILVVREEDFDTFREEDAINRKDEQQFTAIFSLYATMLTLVMVLFSTHTIKEQQKKEIEAHNKEIQHASFEKFFSLLAEYTKFRNSIKKKELRKLSGMEPFEYLYKNYRIKDIQHYSRISNTEDKKTIDAVNSEIKKMNDRFLLIAKKYQIDDLADILFILLNWIRTQEIYYISMVEMSPQEAFSKSEKRILLEEIGKIRKAQMKALSASMSQEEKFVIGKYRHIMWKLDHYFDNGIPLTYRGLYYADELFMYEPTINNLYKSVCDVCYPKKKIQGSKLHPKKTAYAITENETRNYKEVYKDIKKLIKKQQENYNNFEYEKLSLRVAESPDEYEHMIPPLEFNYYHH